MWNQNSALASENFRMMVPDRDGLLAGGEIAHEGGVAAKGGNCASQSPKS